MHEAPRACDKHDPRLPSVDLRNFPRENHFIANNIYISKKIPSRSQQTKAAEQSSFWRGPFIPHQKLKCLTPTLEPFHRGLVAKLSPSFGIGTLALLLSMNDYILL